MVSGVWTLMVCGAGGLMGICDVAILWMLMARMGDVCGEENVEDVCSADFFDLRASGT